jgi:tetratricopeptide (TPR) repeat protein
MPTRPKFSVKGRKKTITVVVVILVLVLAVGAGMLVRWLQHKDSSNGGKNTGNNLNIGENGLPIDTLPEKVREAQDLASSGKVDESNKTIADALSKASGNDEKYNLYLQQGANYENQTQYDQALGAYKNAEAQKQTFTVYKCLGRVEEMRSNKQAAIDYYKKAIPLISPTDPLGAFEKENLEQSIKSLGGA